MTMPSLYATVTERCRYLVWGGPGDYKECETLKEAMLWHGKMGGAIYEPVCAVPVPAAPLAGATRLRCRKCRRAIVHSATWSTVSGVMSRPYHEGCLEEMVRRTAVSAARQAARRAMEQEDGRQKKRGNVR